MMVSSGAEPSRRWWQVGLGSVFPAWSGSQTSRRTGVLVMCGSLRLDVSAVEVLSISLKTSLSGSTFKACGGSSLL
ncbi:hypothetical protein Bca101_067602 [Brassica carinata]